MFERHLPTAVLLKLYSWAYPRIDLQRVSVSLESDIARPSPLPVPLLLREFWVTNISYLYLLNSHNTTQEWNYRYLSRPGTPREIKSLSTSSKWQSQKQNELLQLPSPCCVPISFLSLQRSALQWVMLRKLPKGEVFRSSFSPWYPVVRNATPGHPTSHGPLLLRKALCVRCKQLEKLKVRL